MDSLLSIVQMPGGIPVGTLAIGKAGAINAGLLAASILALSDPALATRLAAVRQAQTDAVAQAPDYANAHYMLALALGRHSQRISILRALADGIATRTPIPEALEDLRGLADEALLVGDGAILRGMRLLHRFAGLVVEPSAAVGVAALLEDPRAFRGARIGLVLCGGNLTDPQVQAWLQSGPDSALK